MTGISFPLKQRTKRAEVAHLHEALALLGFTVADSEKATHRFGASTQAAVRTFQTANRLRITGEVDKATAAALNGILVERGVLDAERPERPGAGLPDAPGAAARAGRRVSGTVRHVDGAAVAGVTVQAFHRGVGRETALGVEVVTSARGEYDITYMFPTGTSRVDLFVRAFGEQDGEKLPPIIAVSPIAITAGTEQVLDLAVADPQYRGPSEFAQASDRLGPETGGAALDRLNADDVALLVRNTGIAREIVTAWIAAKRLADRSGGDHESLFGLVRTENTGALPRLLRLPPARLRRALARAAESNIISLAAGRRAEATTAQLRKLAAAQSASLETPRSLGRLLATATSTTSAQQAGFIDRYAAHDGPVETLWRGLRKDPAFGDAAVDDLQLALRLGTLTANHPPLVEALRASGVTHASQTATLGAEGWKRVLGQSIDGAPVGLPPGIRGATAAERQANYIALLVARSAQALPTAHVAKALKTVPAWRSSSAVAFLDANPDFDLLASSLASRLDAPDLVFDPSVDRARLSKDLATVQRVSRVAPRGQEETVVGALLEHGYSSALAISRRSRAAFRRNTAARLGGDATADTVYRQAQRQVAGAGSAYALLDPNIGGGLLDAIGGVSPGVTSNPTWASLFGDVDYCRCEHCRSIYSPAAYLVALLTWLDGRDAGARTAFERLDQRRPDIQRLELSCENTNTVLPYTDLVNEILEVRVIDPTGKKPNAPEVPVASTGTSPELLANPEYLNVAAYDRHLAEAVFPTLLPFDLWGELGRVYFEHLGVRRPDLMEALSRRGRPRREAIDAERLRLSTQQRDVLTGAATHDVWEYWGYASEEDGGVRFTTDLAVVSTFLGRGGIDFDQLLDVLHCRFPAAAHLRITGLSCNTDEMAITVLGDEVLGRMHLFLRLWRHRSWSMLDLDKALHALQITTIDAAALRRLADLDRMQALTGAPLLEALSWWAPMDTFADRVEKESPVKSLYDRVYLNRAVDPAAEDPASPLALDDARTALRDSAVAWEDVRSTLQAALSIDADELARLLDETIDGVPNPYRVVTGDTATLDGLSALHRHVTLARRLRLTTSELLALLPMAGLDPFDLDRSGAAVTFVETVADIRSSPFTLIQLHYLLEHDPQAETSVGVTDEAIGQVLVEVRDGLARVAADYPEAADPAAADPVGEKTAQYLAQLLTAEAADAVLAALRTEAAAGTHAELEATVTEHLGAFFSFDAADLIRRSVALRFTVIVRPLAAFLAEAQGNAVIVEKVAAFAGRDLDVTQDLLALRLTMTVDSRRVPALAGLRDSAYVHTATAEIVAIDDPEAFAALRRIHKAGVVLSTLDVGMDGQAWLFDVGVRNGLLNPLALPIAPLAVRSGVWSAWTRLVDLAALDRDLPAGEPSLVELLQLLESSDDPAVAEEAFRSSLTTRTGWLRSDLDTLLAAFAPAFPGGWRDGTVLRTLVDAFAAIGRLGVPAAEADGWVTADIGAVQADALRLAAKSKHDEERWPAIARALRDPVRDRQREALVAYLIASGDYADADALFSDLLIDVQMTPCMLTSRIKQAISSVQLFVQRAFLNLEPDIELTRDDAAEWGWMRSYRVWEAARKVFLYPENWIEPDLRLDKSPLFARLENALQQGELDDAAAEKAYTAYLEGLAAIARLEVMAVHHQFEEDGDGTVDVLHVVARTRSTPPVYYYRQWIDRREWTAWEELDAEIEANHTVMALHDRRLFLFWPVVVQKVLSIDDDTKEDYYELKLAWIERLHGQWSGRKVSSRALTIHAATWETQEPHVYFRTTSGERLEVKCRRRTFGLASASSAVVGSFVLDSSSGEMVAVEGSLRVAEHMPSAMFVDRMRLGSVIRLHREEGKLPPELWISAAAFDSDGNAVSDPEDTLVLSQLDAAGSDFSYAYPTQFHAFLSQHGVFLDADDRTYHVMPEEVIATRALGVEDRVDPAQVGTSTSASDDLEPKDPPADYEPELEWDKLQEPEIVANKLREAPAAAVESDGLAGELLAETLTPTDLGLSQSQLGESFDMSDGFTQATTTKYRFSLFYHPYAGDFMKELRRGGIAGLLDPNPEGSEPRLVRQEKSRLEFFASSYTLTDHVLEPYPIQDIDFSAGGAYALYNWELFFHAPLLIACRLSRNQRFEEARRWFHYMFDPTNRSDDDDPLRFWKIKPFYREPDAPIDAFLTLAASTDDSPDAEAARQQYQQQIDTWMDDPFNPHRIAALRTTAYQKTLVMKYLDNLIAWGDQLFRRDTIEATNEATQLYVLALQLLGDRPDALPPRSEPVPTTFEAVRGSLADSVLDNPLVQLENLAPPPLPRLVFVDPVVTAAGSWGQLLFPGPRSTPAPVEGGPPAFYFCIPPNENLLAYWDLAEDRLFKIRHCMNIEGVVRQLPLFEPPIDPGMLVRARAAGIDLSSALADLSAPLPQYRFAVMLQKAQLLNQTVRALGSALLNALEQTDAAALELLRQNQEVAVLDAVRQVKKLTVTEARHALAAAERSLTVVEQRRDYYARLSAAGLRPEELLQTLLMDEARKKQSAGSTAMAIASGIAMIPSMVTGASGVSSPVATTTVVSGLALSKLVELGGQAKLITAASLNAQASMVGIKAGFARRAEEWQHQLELSRREIKQIEKQIEAARARLSIAERDEANHERQIDNARTVRDFMEQKFTGVELRQWAVGQISSVYFQSYQLAYDLAKQAERAYRHELALPDASFIQFGYWDSLKKGLLSGERLQFDLDRMDVGYLDNNRREYEITRHVSLALVDPVALLQLQTTGSCEFTVDESLFDVDYPGQYLRRIKTVSVTVPCVTGPFTGLPMRLTLVASRTRTDPAASGSYPMDPSGEDGRFRLETGAVQSIAICHGRDDAGMLASDPRDERYLPFEGCGAISDWSLTLTSAVPTFDWRTITDVVLHLRYSAREGGELLREAALASLAEQLDGLPLRRAFSARSEFSSELAAFLRPSEGSPEATLGVALSEERFPYLAHDANLRIANLEVVALLKDADAWQNTDITVTTGANVQTVPLTASPVVYGGQPSASLAYAGAAPGEWRIAVPIDHLGAPSEWVDDLILIATYTVELGLG